MNVLNGHPDSLHTYFEKNTTSRNFSQLEFEKSFANGNVFTIKTVLPCSAEALTDLTTNFIENKFLRGLKFLFYTGREIMIWLLGINFSTDKFF